MKRIVTLTIVLSLILPAAAFAQASGTAKDGLLGWLRNNVGMEIGSITLDGTSYSKVVVQPEVRIGRLKLGLYLPVIYKDDLFDPSTWYAPRGNNEWDFGFPKWSTDPLAAAYDFASDLILKIKYLEYGTQYQDPFFIKVGNLQGLTIGHGLVMRNYRNDTDFPSIRRTGVDLGLDLGSLGFEALLNDIPGTQIAGGRFYFRPIKGFGLALGLSAVADLAAGEDLKGTAWQTAGDNMVLIGSGLDAELPIIPQTSALGLRFYADGAVNLPYVKNSFTSPNNGATVPSGFQTNLIWDGNSLKNWGAATGFMGNVLFIDWRLEYRYFTGIFRPSFFDSTYERQRSLYVQQYVGYLDGSKSIANAPTVMGVYGEAGFSILKDKLYFQAGYMWPFSFDSGFDPSTANDELHMRLSIAKGLIPVVNLAGAISYDRWGLVSAISSGNFQLLDSKSVLSGELDLPVPSTPNLTLALVFQTIVATDSSGRVVYVGGDPTKGPKIIPAITIETRFHF